MTENYGYDQASTPPAVGQEPAPATTSAPQYQAPVEPDNVRPIDSGPVEYDLDARRVVTKPDYRLRFQGKTWVVRQPDVGTVIAAEKAPTIEAFMELMFEDQWPDMRDGFEAYTDPGALFEIGQAIARHFDLDAASTAAPRNRRERRAAPRRG